MADERIIFGAEFDQKSVAAGADAVVTKLEQIKSKTEELKTTNEGLKKTVTDLSSKNKELAKDLDFSAKSAQKLEQQISSISVTTRDGRAQIAAMTQELKEWRAEQGTIANRIASNNTLIERHTTSMKTNGLTIKQNEGTLKSLGTSLAETAKQTAKVGEESGKSQGPLSKMYGGLRQIANLIPGIGLSGLILLVYDLSEQFILAALGGDKLAEKLKMMNDIFEEAGKSVGNEYAQLEIFRRKLEDTSISEKERIEIAKSYNKVADLQNQIDLKQIDNLQLINEKIEAQIKLIIARAVSLAATAKLGTFADAYVTAQLKASEKLRQINMTEDEAIKKSTFLLKERQAVVDSFVNNKGSRFNLSQRNQEIDEQINTLFGAGALNKEGLFNLLELRDKAKKELTDAADILNALITPEGITKHTTTAAKAVENVFLQKLAELRARLAASMVKDFQSDTLIKEKFAAQMDKEFQEIATLLKEKKLTGPQADILRGLIRQINQVDLSTALTDFHKKQKDAIDKIDEEIVTASVDAARKRVDNIRNEFDREKEVIAQSYAGTVSGLNKQLKTMLNQIQEDVNKGIVTPAAGQQKAFILTALFGDLITQAGIDKTNRELELAFKTFQRTIQDFKTQLQTDTTGFSEEVTAAIRKQADYFLSGQISYDRYQKNITKILRDEQKLRKFLLLSELKDELTAINAQIEKTTDPTLLEKLKAQQVGVREQIATTNREIAQGDAGDKEGASKNRLASFEAYAHAIEGVLQNVIGFWNQVNAVEAASLDRSIALQQKRVDRAKDIADKGNAEYLEMEQKRLDELERKREENARRQLVLNQALTVSQALVATVSAIAQAVSTGSPIAAIAAVGAVIAAIGAGYAFVKSLQPVSANFYEGSEYVEGRGRPRGKDTVPANLTIGERVVTADRNAEYWDALHAIHNRLIPPDILNDFVNKYPNVNFERLEMATGIKLGFDSLEISSRLEKLNGTMEEVVAAVSGLGFNVSMDQSGFSAALSKYQKAERLKKLS